MKRFAIILSCEEYKNYSEVAFANNDADLLYETLTSYCDYAKQDVYLEQLNIYDETRTPQIILEEIKSLISKAEEGDSVLFYFAGHGDFYENESYLVLPFTEIQNLSTTALPIRDIHEVLKDNGLLNIAVLDCCHSGYDARGISQSKFKWIDEIEDYSGDGWITFAACKYDENSYPDRDLQQGIFTYHFSETIKAFDEGEKIIPELLKVRLFDKVVSHCEGKKKKQTPTYNSSISGNVSIARRKIEEEKEDKEHKIDSADEFEILKSRLDNIKSNIISTSDQGKINLKEIAKLCENQLNDKRNDIKDYDCKVEINELESVNHIDEDIKKEITKFIDTKKYIPVHDVRVNRVYEKNNNPVTGSYLDSISKLSKQFGRTLGYSDKPVLKKIEYVLNQDWDMPDSYINIDINNNEYMPKGELFVYICPLKIKVLLLAGVKIGDNVKIKRERYINLNNIDNQQIIDFIDDVIKSFNKDYYDNLLKYMEYLEWEGQL